MNMNEIIDKYTSIFEIEKNKIIIEIENYIKDYFKKDLKSLYLIRDFINYKHSEFSKYVVFTIPKITLNNEDVSLFTSDLRAELYNSAQQVLKDFTEFTNNILKELKEQIEEN